MYVYSNADHPQCLRGFMSGRVFDHIKGANELTIRDNGRTYLRQCKETFIKKWVIGARLENFFENPGYIQALSKKFELVPLTTTLHTNVYEYELNPPMFVNNYNYYSHISVNSSQIFYQKCAIFKPTTTGCEDQPLVAVDVGKSYSVSSIKNIMFIFYVRMPT